MARKPAKSAKKTKAKKPTKSKAAAKTKAPAKAKLKAKVKAKTKVKAKVKVKAKKAAPKKVPLKAKKPPLKAKAKAKAKTVAPKKVAPKKTTPAAKPAPKIKRVTIAAGVDAPDFTRPTDGGGSVSLAALRGKAVILYFYPRDDTPGCTVEACAFRDNLPNFAKVNATVLGVSTDSAKSHDKFKTKYSLPFPLIADEDHSLAEAYGVWVEKDRYGRKYMGTERATFLIDTRGKVVQAWHKVKVEGHAEEVLDAAMGR